MLNANAARRAEIFAAPGFAGNAAAVAGLAVRNVADVFVRALLQRNEIRGVFAHRSAQRNFAALALAHISFLQIAVGVVVVVLVRSIENAENAGGFVRIKPRTPVRKSKAVRIFLVRARLERKTHSVARTAKIRISNANRTNQTFARAVTGANAESARALFLDFNFDNDGIWLDARQPLNVHVLEKSEIVKPLHRTAHKFRVERLANFLAHFAHNHVIFRFGVALDFVAFQHALVYANRQHAFQTVVKIEEPHKNVAVLVIFFLNRAEIVVERILIDNGVAADGDKFLELVLGINGVALELDAPQHRIFQNVVRDQKTFGNFGKSHVGVVEKADVLDSVEISQSHPRIKIVANVRKDCIFSGRQRNFGRALKSYVDDSFAVEPRHVRQSSVVNAGSIRRRLEKFCSRIVGVRIFFSGIVSVRFFSGGIVCGIFSGSIVSRIFSGRIVGGIFDRIFLNRVDSFKTEQNRHSD